jgi:hypothetical protein
VDRSYYTKQEYLSLARNHQAACITYNVGGTAANPPISFVSLDFRRTSQASPYPSIDAQHRRFRCSSPRRAYRTQMLSRWRSSDTPSTRNNYKFSPITEGIKSGPDAVSFTANRGSFTLRAKDSQGLFKAAGLAEGGSNSANVDRWPSRRSNRLLPKSRNSPVARSGLTNAAALDNSFSVPIFTPRNGVEDGYRNPLR